MSSDLEHRIESLERSACRWRRLALASWATLVLVLVGGLAFVVAAGQRAEEGMARARQAKQEAVRERERAEAARGEVEQAKEAQRGAQEQARRQLYLQHISRA